MEAFMFDLGLQIWGGMCYLLNKICFSKAERSKRDALKRTWRIRSWSVYLAGVPAWVIVFISKHNWIAAAVESGGSPAMIMGLVNALRGRDKLPWWLDYISRVSVGIGFMLSVYDFGGISTIHQYLELGIAAGFLLGTYLLAIDNWIGYIFFMLGNVCCAALMGMEGFYVLACQQTLSLVFVTDACVTRLRVVNAENEAEQPEELTEL